MAAKLSVLAAFAAVANGRVFVDPSDGTTILEGATLLPYCEQTTQVCETHFGKNVYATENPIMDRLWTEALFPDMYNQFDDNYEECGFGSKFISMDTCAQLHAPMTTYHPEGGLSVDYVQRQYSIKWNYVMTQLKQENTAVYDSFLDNSAAYWVDDLSNYYSIWKDQNAEIIFLRWKMASSSSSNKESEDNDKWYYSMITHNGNSGHLDHYKYRTGSTLSQYELISDKFSEYDNGDSTTDNILFLETEQRIFWDKSLLDYATQGSGCYLYPIGARRSVTDVDANVEWYKKIFASTITDETTQIQRGEWIDYNGNLVKYAHVKLHTSEIATTISFFERINEDESTYGEFKVSNFENGLSAVHEEIMLNPFCGIDRWFDMHYAVEFKGDTTAAEEILEAIMYSGDKYTLYGDNSEHFLYMPEPNGHSIQVVFSNSYDISLYTDPFAWTWCKTNCSDEQLSYQYGDAIFEWNENTKFGKSKLSQQIEFEKENEKEKEREEATNVGIFNKEQPYIMFLKEHIYILILFIAVGIAAFVHICGNVVNNWKSSSDEYTNIE